MATATAVPKSKTAKPRKAATNPAADRKAAALKAAALFKMIAEATRVEVLLTLAEGERNVGELCTGAGISQPACSHHLALMRHSDLIVARRAGKNNFYRLTETGETLSGLAKSLIG